jgi:hypothetical protein
MLYKTYVDPREREDIRAHQGEDIWVVLNHVRAEKRKAFEHFLHSILMPAIAHVHPETYNKVRVLHPTKPNGNGTYTYIFLMDPVVPDGIYDISSILHEFYKPELANEYMKIWNEALVSPQVGYDLVQSTW